MLRNTVIEYALVSKVSYLAKTRHTMYLPKTQQCITSHANEMMGSAMQTFTVSNYTNQIEVL